MTDKQKAPGEQEGHGNRASEGASPSAACGEESLDTTPADTGEQSPAEDPLELRAKEIERLNGELLQMKDKYLRAMAEMDNMRRRNDKEKRDLLQFGQERLIQDLLPVLDSCDKALGGTDGGGVAHQSEVDRVVDGIKLVFKQLTSALERHGLKAVESMDKPFDPNLHQAISRLEMAQLDHDQVIQECSKGYLLHERLVRPAMVVVGVAAEHKPAGSGETSVPAEGTR